MYNNGNNKNIKTILDSSKCDQLPVANTQTLWTLFNVEIDNVTVGHHITLLQRYHHTFNNKSIGICNDYFPLFKESDHILKLVLI